jgi:hypothetical protein
LEVVVRVLFLPLCGAVALALAAGCGNSGPEDKKADAAASVTMTTVKIKEFEKALETYRGKVVLVDIWHET